MFRIMFACIIPRSIQLSFFGMLSSKGEWLFSMNSRWSSQNLSSWELCTMWYQLMVKKFSSKTFDSVSYRTVLAMGLGTLLSTYQTVWKSSGTFKTTLLSFENSLASIHLECPFCHPDNTLPNLVAATLPKQILPFAKFWQMQTQIWQMLSNFLAKQV